MSYNLSYVKMRYKTLGHIYASTWSISSDKMDATCAEHLFFWRFPKILVLWAQCQSVCTEVALVLAVPML